MKSLRNMENAFSLVRACFFTVIACNLLSVLFCYGYTRWFNAKQNERIYALEGEVPVMIALGQNVKENREAEAKAQLTEFHKLFCFDTFYEYLRDVYSRKISESKVRIENFDLDNMLQVLEPYYKGGTYDFLLNARDKTDLQRKRFVVFELDNIKDNPVIFPVVTLIIMDTFITKMRFLDPGVRKMILIEEAWKAISKAGMAEFIKYLYKTVRKHNGGGRRESP